jgi:dTDP-4-amino-4,6-dideoxygalactose transaminase
VIPFNQLKPVHEQLAAELQEAAQRVLASGWFVLGPEVEAFEGELAAWVGTAHAVGVANGTDAVELALRAAGVVPGDEVITVSHTAVATVCGVERAGGKPVLVDIDPVTYTIDPERVEAAMTPRTKAIVPVHLYGHLANVATLQELASRHGVALVEDCAQALGGTWQGTQAGCHGALAAVSFYPTKNLGACGDGGAVLTNDPDLAERLRRLRMYGQPARVEAIERGVNSRLDELQAALLRVKLRHLAEHNRQRRELAELYGQLLKGVELPQVLPGYGHAWHLFVVRHPRRDELAKRLAEQGIGTLIHYPIPVHRQRAYADLGYGPGSLPRTEQAVQEILSLPLWVGMTKDDVRRVAAAVTQAATEL